METITIHRSLYGLFRIFIVGMVASSAVFALAHMVGQGHTLDDFVPTTFIVGILDLLGFVSLVITVVAMLVYDAGKIILSAQGISVVSYQTLFWSTSGMCEWRDVEDASVIKTSVVGGLFDIGELRIETAGTRPNLSLSWVPRVSYWQEYVVPHAK